MPWLILGTCLAMQVFCGGMITNLVGVSADDLAQSLGLPKVTVLLLTSSLFYLAVSGFSVVSGRLAHYFPSKARLLTAAAAVATGFLILANASQPWQLGLAYGLFFAFGFANIQLTTNALVVQWYDQNRGRALGILATGVSIAGVVLAPLYTAVASIHGWRVAIGLLGICALLPLLPTLVFVRDRHSGHTEAEAWPPAAAVPAKVETRATRGLASIAAMSISCGISSLIIMAVLANLRRIAMTAGISGASVAVLFSMLSMSAILGKLLFMGINQRLTQRQIAAIPLISVGCACVLFIFLSFPTILIGVAALGFALGISIPGMSTVLAEHHPHRFFLKAAGTCMAISTLGLVVGPPGMAALYGWTGSFSRIFIGLAILLAVLVIPTTRLLPAAARCGGRPNAEAL